MFKKVTVIATALVCVAMGGCAVKRYPIALTLAPTAAESMTCDQLNAELANVRNVEGEIGKIEATGRTTDGQKPKLYSTAKSDADRAVQARREAVTGAMQAKSCPAA